MITFDTIARALCIEFLVDITDMMSLSHFDTCIMCVSIHETERYDSKAFEKMSVSAYYGQVKSQYHQINIEKPSSSIHELKTKYMFSCNCNVQVCT